SDRRTLSGVVNQTVDSFTIPTGVTVPPPTPPGQPFPDTFPGPGAVIGSEPSSRTITTISQGATIAGSRSLDADVFSLRLGPYAEVPISELFSLLFNGGLYLAIGNSKFGFSETVTIPGVGTEIHAGSGSQTDFLIGG